MALIAVQVSARREVGVTEIFRIVERRNLDWGRCRQIAFGRVVAGELGDCPTPAEVPPAGAMVARGDP